MHRLRTIRNYALTITLLCLVWHTHFAWLAHAASLFGGCARGSHVTEELRQVVMLATPAVVCPLRAPSPRGRDASALVNGNLAVVPAQWVSSIPKDRILALPSRTIERRYGRSPPIPFLA